MKLSQFGILDSESQCIDLIEPIISNAYQSKQTIRFDSEDSSSTDKILNVCLNHNIIYKTKKKHYIIRNVGVR